MFAIVRFVQTAFDIGELSAMNMDLFCTFEERHMYLDRW